MRRAVLDATVLHRRSGDEVVFRRKIDRDAGVLLVVATDTEREWVRSSESLGSIELLRTRDENVTLRASGGGLVLDATGIDIEFKGDADDTVLMES